jgi:ABC-type Fe3+-hydroxamate transport system substrate-binding protein
MRELTDMLQRKLQVPEQPQRIISLVPSQTELLFDLGLSDEVVGITKFCVHPEAWFRSKRRVGGTKKVDHHVINSLHPDLIIANKEENTKEDIEALSEAYPVWVSDVKSPFDALQMIRSIGILTGTTPASNNLVNKLEFALDSRSSKPLKKALYLIWKDPYMAAGADTFIHHSMALAGFENVLVDATDRYPTLEVTDIERLQPEYLLLSSEPFPFRGKHTEAVRKQFPHLKVTEVDGELFSWYGSRMLKALPYFKQLRSELNS